MNDGRAFLIAMGERFDANIAAHPFFWIFFAAGLWLIIATVEFSFKHKWLRALVCGSLAVETVLFLCGGYL